MGCWQKYKQQNIFALIGDETRDTSGKKQFAIPIRWVNEDLITLAEVEQTDGATLTATLKNVLICNGLQISKCYDQAYDGASNMSGHLNGVAARIQKEQPQAHYVHCVAHSLNLCLQDCGQNCRTVREALTVAIELASVICASPKSRVNNGERECLTQYKSFTNDSA